MADGRPGDGEGLPEVGFGSRDLNPTPQGPAVIRNVYWGAWERWREYGSDHWTSKRKWEISLQASLGHRRRPGPLPPEESKVSSRVVFNVHELCAYFRGVGDCWVS